MSKRGRPTGSVSRGTYFRMLKETESPKHYKQIIKEFTAAIKRGRHPSKPESLRIISGRITVKASPIRTSGREYKT